MGVGRVGRAARPGARAPARAQPRPWPRRPGAGALVVAALASAALLATPLAAPPGGVPVVGPPAPDVRLRPLHGVEEQSLSTYRGKVLVLAFVASWCRACRRLAPDLAALKARHEREGFEVLGLSHEARGRLIHHRARFPEALPLLQCTGRTAVRYGADVVPTLALLDREGVLRGRWQGASPTVVRDLRARTARTLAR
ncbi:MAG: peroxiredoxin family protein [Sandaracinaceae bacterium]